MLDMHTHILPNVDDGSKSLDISRRLLLQEINQGITKVILTPHQNKNNLDKNGLIEKFNSFKDDVKDLNILLALGCEIYYYPELKNDLLNDKILTMDNSKYVLIEFSTRIEENISDILYDLSLTGYKIILAHIERYSYLKLSDYDEIHKYGKIQVNSKSILNKEYKKQMKYLLKNNLIDFIASDCHDLDRRNVEFMDALKYLEKKYKDTYLRVTKDFNFNN
jgi:protein-tyrosine phosphatase